MDHSDDQSDFAPDDEMSFYIEKNKVF